LITWWLRVVVAVETDLVAAVVLVVTELPMDLE
jgi:hypothetical protein